MTLEQQRPRASGRPRHLLVAGLGLALLALFGLGAAQFGSRVAAADQVASVSCDGASPGLSDCTITLNLDIAAGGSFTATLTNPDAFFVACNSLSVSAACTTSNTSVTFFCTSDCPVGSTYRDVVQVLAGSAEDQVFSTTGTIVEAALAAPSSCVDSSGNPIACPVVVVAATAAPTGCVDTAGNPIACPVVVEPATTVPSTCMDQFGATVFCIAAPAPQPAPAVIGACLDALGNVVSCDSGSGPLIAPAAPDAGSGQ